MNNACSDIKPLSQGVPQGSILDPLSFNVYRPINDITKVTRRNILLYADDSVIFESSDDINFPLHSDTQAEQAELDNIAYINNKW